MYNKMFFLDLYAAKVVLLFHNRKYFKVLAILNIV